MNFQPKEDETWEEFAWRMRSIAIDLKRRNHEMRETLGRATSKLYEARQRRRLALAERDCLKGLIGRALRGK